MSNPQIDDIRARFLQTGFMNNYRLPNQFCPDSSRDPPDQGQPSHPEDCASTSYPGCRRGPLLPPRSADRRNDILLDVILGGLGVALGVACGMTTHVWRDREGFPVLQGQRCRRGALDRRHWQPLRVRGVLEPRRCARDCQLLHCSRHHESERVGCWTRAHGPRRSYFAPGSYSLTCGAHHDRWRSPAEFAEGSRRGVTQLSW